MAKTNKGASALKKINTRVNALAKKFPGKKRKTLQKQAGAEYRAGKLKAKRKKPAARKKVAKRRVRSTRKKVARRRRVASVGAVKRVARRRTRRKVSARPKVIIRTRTKTVRIGRRVGAKKSIMPVLAIAAIGIGAFLLLRKKTPPVQLVQTSNAARNNTAANILAYAQAGGATLAAITKLIQALNSSNDAQVTAMQSALSAGNSLQDDSSVQAIINAGGGSNIARVMY